MPKDSRDPALIELGRRIRERRREAGLSINALAEGAGLNDVFVGQVERGQRDASYSTIRKLSAALGLSPAMLLGEERPTYPADVTGVAQYLARWPPTKRRAAVRILREIEDIYAAGRHDKRR